MFSVREGLRLSVREGLSPSVRGGLRFSARGLILSVREGLMLSVRDGLKVRMSGVDDSVRLDSFLVFFLLPLLLSPSSLLSLLSLALLSL